MKIAVCVKQVPDSETRINLPAPAPELDQSGFTRVLNPYDAYAVEEAIKIKEAGTDVEVTAFTIGTDAVKETLKKDCLAVGCDKAVIITDPALDKADEAAVATVLAAASSTWCSADSRPSTTTRARWASSWPRNWACPT